MYYAINYAAQHLSVSSMTDEEPGHLVPLLLTGVVQGGVAILVLGMQLGFIFLVLVPLHIQSLFSTKRGCLFTLPGSPLWSCQRPEAGAPPQCVLVLRLDGVGLLPTGPSGWCLHLGA